MGVLLFCTDLVFIFIVWLLRPSAMKNVGGFILMFSGLMLCVSIWLEKRRYRKVSEAFEHLLETPDESNYRKLQRVAGRKWKKNVTQLYEKLLLQSSQIHEKQTESEAYREFIEEWVHEMKTPLSLSTLILNNREEEMSSYVYQRMNYVQQQLQEKIDRILYYARLQADHVDYKFTRLRLDICVQKTVDEYRMLAAERNISLQMDLQPYILNSDEKVLHFMLAQLLSNACKYADSENGKVEIAAWRREDKIYLAIRNNGVGVPQEDAPFIFDKGFTGNHPDRQKATGMGLYLVSKYAEALCMEVQLEDVAEGDGFGIVLVFPAERIDT